MADYTFDATNKKMGRLATEVAEILQGKKSATYAPRLPGKDTVRVTNLKKLALLTKKAEGRRYYWHTGYMGHLKTATFAELFAKNPGKLFKEVVAHMLPKNRLQVGRLKRLTIEE